MALAPPSSSAGFSGRLAWLGALLVLAAAVAAFEPALLNAPCHDDRTQLDAWPVPAGASQWLQTLTQPWWPPDHHKNIYRPLTRLSIQLQRALHPGWLGGLYGANILFHALMSLGVLCFALGLPGWRRAGALAAALLFALHPAHSEAVHQIVGRAEVLASAAMLAGLTAWVRRPARWGLHIWAQPLALGLALGFKEHAVLYPLYLALAMAAVPTAKTETEPKPRLNHWRMGRAHAALLGLLAAVTAAFLGLKGVVTGGLIEAARSVPAHENFIAAWPWWQRLPAVAGIFGYAASRWLWPVNLSPDYSAYSLNVTAGWSWPWCWVGVAVAGLILLYIIRNARRGGRGWLLAVATLGAWALTSNGPFVIGVLTAQRLWYWPSLGATLGLGWGFQLLWERWEPSEPARRRLILVAALAAAMLLAAAWRHATAWRNQQAYSQSTLDRFPRCWRAHLNLAREGYQNHQFEEGLIHARQATGLFPDQAIGWDWLGLNAMFSGLPEESDQAFARATSLDPRLHETWRHWANLLASQGHPAQAAEKLEEYLRYGPVADRPQIEQRIADLRRAGTGGK